MFNKILIANRGEIACRVIRTARRMGIATVAVFSDADRHALHVRSADEAHHIGPAPARDSYLRIDRIIEAARASDAEAIHPGYGFLSENAAFAEACTAAGIVFIGPPASAIRAMGSKSAAKALMERAGVPLVPGYHGENQSPALLAREAGRIGYPVLIKASAGGGGKGMRVVENAAGFPEALAAAQGEARASFGDDHVLVERYLTRPRHIEVQVFADRSGDTIYLFERDCSIQRRHQKVVEEAPAPGLSPERRAAMGRAACNAARTIGYEGAGTVEFIAEDDAFYFMEMNTRLQVEHPVTEMITGQDLVEWQLRVANGEPLPLRQDALTSNGHAIEVRLYAEDPARSYMPSIGTLLHLRPPPEDGHIRVDTGVQQGDEITVHYDPMIAKLIVWDQDRTAAARRMHAALLQYEVAGVHTNLDLLRRVVSHPAFLAADLNTGFLDRHKEVLQPAQGAPPLLALAAVAAAILAERTKAARHDAFRSGDPHSPWALGTAWRLNGEGYQDLVFRSDETNIPMRTFPRLDGSFDLELTGTRYLILAQEQDVVLVDGVRRRAPVARTGDRFTVLIEGTPWPLQLLDPLAPPTVETEGGDQLVAPMPGRVISVHAEPGQFVTKGDVLLVLEAMKVQMRLTAPRNGAVSAVHARAGDLIDDGAELIRFGSSTGSDAAIPDASV